MLSIVIVKGTSMVPTLHDGERVLAYTPLFYCQYREGRIVTLQHFQPPAPPIELRQKHERWFTSAHSYKEVSEIYVKRLVGLPCNTVHIARQDVEKLNLPVIDPTSEITEGGYVWTIPHDCVFVRGDGTTGVDSISWGPIPMSSLQQIVLCRFPSLRRIR